MAANKTILGVVLVAFALTVAGVASASAEFFGCNDQRGRVVTRSHSKPVPQRSTSRITHEFAAQRSRHANYSTRSSVRRSSRNW